MNKRLLNLVIRTYELKGAAYQVMLALAWNSSATNECSISISELAAAAHLTKQAVIRALHSLTAPNAAAEGRSVLTRVRQGRATGMPATYLINIDLIRDLNRRRRYRLATEAQGRGTGVTPKSNVDSTISHRASNGATPVRRGRTRTLRGQIKQDESETLGLIALTESKPLSTHEVNKILKAQVKQVARNISAIVNR
jgi:hypothetical protein